MLVTLTEVVGMEVETRGQNSGTILDVSFIGLSDGVKIGTKRKGN